MRLLRSDCASCWSATGSVAVTMSVVSSAYVLTVDLTVLMMLLM
jgi:hypothetical protein